MKETVIDYGLFFFPKKSKKIHILMQYKHRKHVYKCKTIRDMNILKNLGFIRCGSSYAVNERKEELKTDKIGPLFVRHIVFQMYFFLMNSGEYYLSNIQNS